jgi:hypothetical protein
MKNDYFSREFGRVKFERRISTLLPPAGYTGKGGGKSKGSMHYPGSSKGTSTTLNQERKEVNHE